MADITGAREEFLARVDSSGGGLSSLPARQFGRNLVAAAGSPTAIETSLTLFCRRIGHATMQRDSRVAKDAGGKRRAVLPVFPANPTGCIARAVTADRRYPEGDLEGEPSSPRLLKPALSPCQHARKRRSHLSVLAGLSYGLWLSKSWSGEGSVSEARFSQTKFRTRYASLALPPVSSWMRASDAKSQSIREQ